MPYAEHDISRALAHNEFLPYFQTIVDLRTGALHGFEILARWQHRTDGLVGPCQFIPPIERSGLMNGLTKVLLTQAFAAVRELPRNFRLSINLSPAQLHDLSLPDLMRRLADESEFDLGRLTVELTETALVDDLDLAGTVAVNLKKLGVRLALDDFGTGYSSLLHLQALPFDELKVDISFVRSMVHSRQSRKITAAVVGLGISLGLQTVAEGIEDQTQAHLLARQGCNLGQGFLYGGPITADQLSAALAVVHPGVCTATETPASIACPPFALEVHPIEPLSQLRAIYDGAPVGLAYLDRELRYVNVNQRLAQLNGLSIQAHLGRKVADVLPGLSLQAKPYLFRALAGESIAGVELYKPAAISGGLVTTLLVAYEPVRDEVGEVLGVSVSVMDISVMKYKEEALRESEDHYRHMVELNPQIPWVLDSQGNAIAISSRWYALTGFSEEQASNYGWIDALHADDRERTLESITASVREGTAIDLQYRIRGEDGGWSWIRSRGAPRRGPGGDIIRWYGSAECIDDAKRATEQLQCSELMLRATFDAVPVGIVLAESATGRVIKANPRAEQLLGIRFNENMVWTDQPWNAMDRHGQRIELSRLPLTRALRSGESTQAQEVLLHRPDDSRIWITVTATPIFHGNGDLFGAVLLVQDIDSSRREHEHLLGLTEELMHIASRMASVTTEQTA